MGYGFFVIMTYNLYPLIQIVVPWKSTVSNNNRKCVFIILSQLVHTGFQPATPRF